MKRFLSLFRGAPVHPVGPDGRMALSDHLRELRARLMRVGLYLLIGFSIALFFYDRLFDLIAQPYNHARELLDQDQVTTKPVIMGIGAPLLFQLKLCAAAALVATSPLWLWEIWRFIVPALHRHERKWSLAFSAIAGPLFIGGVALGWYVLPRGLEVLLGFTQDYVESLVDFNVYFGFMVRMLLVFGLSLEIPLFVMLLNLAGVVKGRALKQYRPFIVMGTFVFGAVATPTTDPFGMIALALPMLLLLLLVEVLARIVDRRRASRSTGTDQWADDEVSPL